MKKSRDHEIVQVRTLYIPEYCLLQVAERKADILPVLRNVDAPRCLSDHLPVLLQTGQEANGRWRIDAAIDTAGDLQAPIGAQNYSTGLANTSRMNTCGTTRNSADPQMPPGSM